MLTSSKTIIVQLKSSPALCGIQVNRSEGAVQFAFRSEKPEGMKTADFEAYKSQVHHILDSFVNDGGCTLDGEVLHFPSAPLSNKTLLNLADLLEDNGLIGERDLKKIISALDLSLSTSTQQAPSR